MELTKVSLEEFFICQLKEVKPINWGIEAKFSVFDSPMLFKITPYCLPRSTEDNLERRYEEPLCNNYHDPGHNFTNGLHIVANSW